MDYKEQVEQLKNLEAIAYGYNINGEVLGMDCSDFEKIMVDAVESITDLLASADAADARAEKAERERDAILGLCGKIIVLCSPPKEWNQKLFRHIIKRPGDYMGTGYPFLDSFNKIYDEFVETADDEIYNLVRCALEKEFQNTGQKYKRGVKTK